MAHFEEEDFPRLTGSDIAEIMNSQGNLAKAVVLCSDGTSKEVTYNSTPKDRHVETFVKGSPTIVGQWCDLEVIIVCNRDQQNLPPNKHKLRYPFHKHDLCGDLFCYRFNSDCEVVDFTLQEYQLFAANASEDVEKENENENEKEEEEESVDVASFDGKALFEEFSTSNHQPHCEEPDNSTQDVIAGMIPIVREQLRTSLGRNPTVEEIAETVTRLAERLGINVQEPQEEKDNVEEEEEEEEEEDEAIACLVPMVREQFVSRVGREPTAEELDNAVKLIADRMGLLGGDDDDDEEYIPEEDEEEEEEEDEDEEEFNSEDEKELEKEMKENDNFKEYSQADAIADLTEMVREQLQLSLQRLPTEKELDNAVELAVETMGLNMNDEDDSDYDPRDDEEDEDDEETTEEENDVNQENVQDNSESKEEEEEDRPTDVLADYAPLIREQFQKSIGRVASEEEVARSLKIIAETMGLNEPESADEDYDPKEDEDQEESDTEEDELELEEELLEEFNGKKELSGRLLDKDDVEAMFNLQDKGAVDGIENLGFNEKQEKGSEDELKDAEEEEEEAEKSEDDIGTEQMRKLLGMLNPDQLAEFKINVQEQYKAEHGVEMDPMHIQRLFGK